MKRNLSKSLPARLLNRARDALFIRPLLMLWRRRLRGKAMVYLYHRIGQAGHHDFLDSGGSPLTRASEFADDIKMLKAFGAHFIRFSELARCDFDSDKFFVVMTIDDGFASNYVEGMRVAESEQIPLTIFQCSGMVGPNHLIWEHQLYYLYCHPTLGDAFREQLTEYPDWPANLNQLRETIHPLQIQACMDLFVCSHPTLTEELREIAAILYPTAQQVADAATNGHEIASHGHSHFKRSNINQGEFDSELRTSRQQLEKMTGARVPAFSYPFNSYLPEDKLLCANHYSMVATVDGGWVTGITPMLEIPRNTFPGAAKNKLRQRRWLLTGQV